MCERCSLRQKAEIFVSPDMRLATAVLRQFWWGSVVGRDLVGGGGVVTCLWVHWVWCLGNQGLIMFTGNAKSYLLNLVIVLLERHRNKCLIENVTVIASYFTVLLLINISELHLINNVHFSINSTELTSSPVFRFLLIKKQKQNNNYASTWQIFYFKFGKWISCHHSHNTVIMNNSLGVHPSKHKGQIYCLWGCWAAGLLLTSVPLTTHLPRQQAHGVV